MSNDEETTGPADPLGGGRRQGERRQAQVPFAGEDRRKAERRAASDRRTSPRESDLPPDEG